MLNCLFKPVAELLRKTLNQDELSRGKSEYEFAEYRLQTAGEWREKDMPTRIQKRREEMRSIHLQRQLHSRPVWALADLEVQAIVLHLGGNPKLGIAALNDAHLEDTWNAYMEPELSAWWRGWLFEDEEESLLYRHLSELLRSHSEGTLSFKAVVISEILLKKGVWAMVGNEQAQQSYDISRYFRNIVLSFFKYLFYRNDTNVYRWHESYEYKNEQLPIHHFVDSIIDFYTSIGSIQDTVAQVLHYLEISEMLDEISTSLVALGFGYGRAMDCVPRLIHGEATILGISQATFLSYLLRGEQSKKFNWEMLYNSKIHGSSYLLFWKMVGKESSTFLFLKDENGYIFGAYIDRPWLRGKTFFGGKGCFLFRLYPTVKILPASAANQNYCYFNFGDKLNPVGLGFGGDKDFFGIQIDLSRKRGISADACPTYADFERLSRYNFFSFMDIEVWKVRPEREEDEKGYSMRSYEPISVHHLLC